MIKFYVIKKNGQDIGCEIHVGNLKFFICNDQGEYKGIRIGEYPGDHIKEDAVLIS